MQAAALKTRQWETCACNSGCTLMPHYHNSEVASTYYESYQGRRLTDESNPFKFMSRDTEQDENLGQRNLAYFAKGICNSEAMPLTFPVLELTNSHYLILDYAS